MGQSDLRRCTSTCRRYTDAVSANTMHSIQTNLKSNSSTTLQQTPLEASFQSDCPTSAQAHNAQQTAIYMWADSTDLSAQHPIVVHNRITPFGARQNSEGDIIVPVYGPDGDLVSLQFIYGDGSKSLLPNSETKSGRMIMGNLEDGFPIILCNCWITACFLHVQAKCAAVVCFSDDNRDPVKAALWTRCPQSPIIIVEDHDPSGSRPH